jgi:hypothetical protein
MLAPMANCRLRCFVLLLAICSACPLATLSQSANSASPDPLSLQEYIAELDHCAALLSLSPVNSKAVHDLRTTLPAKWNVRVGQARYAIGTEWLSGALSSIETDPSASNTVLAPTRQKLLALRGAAQSLIDSAQGEPNAAGSRSRLNAVLSAREFRGQQGPTWMDLLKQRIRDWIDRQLERLFGRVPGRKIGNWVAWIVVILGGLLLSFWTLRFLMSARQHEEMDLSGATPVGRDWRRWLREAREAAARRDYRMAIHAAYWAAIVRMEETKSLPEDRARTPRESLKLIDRGSAAYAPLLQLTRRFEPVWYGYRSATAADWDDASQQLEILGCPRS